jgi:glycogen synthase
VGRVSKEKNLQILVNVFRLLSQSDGEVKLVIVGDGPYRQEMEQALAGTPAVFMGYMEGEALAEVYASCDLFVFPSTTDTFGNVVLEAQASAVPVIVTDCGGPQENIIPGKTGIIVQGNSETSLWDGIQSLLSEPKRLKQMGEAAREYALNRSFDKAFREGWDLYSETLGHGDVRSQRSNNQQEAGRSVDISDEPLRQEDPLVRGADGGGTFGRHSAILAQMRNEINHAMEFAAKQFKA